MAITRGHALLSLPLSLAAIACTGPGDTLVALDVRYDDAWGMTTFDVTAADRQGSVDPSHDVVIAMPDDWAGTAIEIELRGLRGDEIWAHGEVTVTPVRDDIVGATLDLSRLPCGAWCTPGATTCIGDGVAICEQRDADSCFEWSDPLACGGATPYCSLGTCLADCIDECAPGEMRCAGPAGEQACGEADSDACRDWMPVVACSGGDTCSNGTCRPGCDDECVEGITRCAGGGVETCGDLDVDGCTEWGPGSPCESGSCTDGMCDAECQDECTAATCVGLVHHACGQFDTDPCDDLSSGTSCVPAADCVDGACSPTAGCTTSPTVCDEPPDPVCVDATTLRVYAAAGTCTADVCDYPATDATCAGGCSAGACTCGTTTCVETFAANQDGARAITLDATHVYWTNSIGGEVRRRPLAGGPIETIASGQFEADGIAVDATSIYWSTWLDDEIRRRAKSGGATSVFASGPDLTGPQQVVADATHVYWAQTHGWRVLRRSKTGGAVEPLADGGFSGELAIDNQAVYFTAFDPINEVRRVAKDTGAETVVASAQGGARGIAVDSTHVYWTNPDEDQVARRAKTGGAIELIAQAQDGARGVAVDDTYVYWTNYASGEVMRRGKTGGPVQTLAEGQAGALLIAVNSTHVYWTNLDGDRVMRIPLSCLCAP